MEYTIELKNGRRSTYSVRDKLKKEGFRFEEKRWRKKTTSKFSVWKWRILYGLRAYVYIEELHERGKTYRYEYFSVHKPLIKNRYHCAYCGKILPKSKLEVDHIIPVQKAKTSSFWQKILKITCRNGVNDIHNLTTACHHCNRKKGARTSFWVFRGWIGRYYISWILLYLSIIFGLCILFLPK